MSKNNFLGRTDSVEGTGLVIGGIYFLESLAVVGFLAWYRTLAYESVGDALLTMWGMIGMGALVGAAVLAFLIARACYRLRQAGSNTWVLGLVMNILVVGTLFPAAEVVLRRVAVGDSAYDVRLGGYRLYPRQWQKVTSTYGTVLEKAQRYPTYLISDDALGWTVGPNRTSENALYVSSAEGLRSPVKGAVLKSEQRPCRIALIGDSYTFGENVAFEDTWGSVLDSLLGRRCQILNFGVIGYGIDQMYLRYLHDVRSWHPDLVIVAFIDHDLRRTMTSYGFLTFPDGRFPFIKPRFVLRGNELEVINHPLISSQQLFGNPSIHDLPFIKYDIGYEPSEWDRPGLAFATRSYLFRVLYTFMRPLDRLGRPETSLSETTELNRALLLKLREAIESDGAKPLMVSLPTEWERMDGLDRTKGGQLLTDAHITHLELTSCMKPFATKDLYNAPAAGGHYSVKGNREVANCLIGDVKSML